MRYLKRNKKYLQGFTLIELLIVITLLGAMAAIMLPSLSANRTKAMEATCDYNQAVTIKTLNDHVMMQGTLPDRLHIGTKVALVSGTDPVEADLMEGLPGKAGETGTTIENMISNLDAHDLTAEESDSLKAAGINTLLCGEDTEIAVAAAVVVPVINGWTDDASAAVTFNTKSEGDLENPDGVAATGDEGVIVPLFITPGTDWDKSNGGAWGNVADIKAGAAKVGVCKVPLDKDFSYYIAYVKVFSSYDGDGEPIPAELVGTSCPECGITNP